MNNYTLERLQAENKSYCPNNVPTQPDEHDLNIVNRLLEALAAAREGAQAPTQGDSVRYTSDYGDFYQNAMIDSINGERVSLCEQPSAYALSNGHVSISGGAFKSVDSSKLEYIGEKERLFWSFGSCGACAHGGIYFMARVHEWQYTPEHPMHGKYTTEHYAKRYVSSDAMGSEFKAWATTYNAVIFVSKLTTSFVVFSAKVKTALVTQQEYNKLKLPEDTRLCNGTIIRVKVDCDSSKNTITEFRFHNANNNYYNLHPRQYMLAERGVNLWQR